MLPSPAGHTPSPLPRLRGPVVLALVAIVAAGGLLRAWGANAGAPYRMGSDEPVVLDRVFRMLDTGDLNPHFFDYGGLMFYLHAAAGAVTARVAGPPEWGGDLLVPSRLVTAALGTLTILVVFALGRRHSPAVGLLAAVVMATLPAQVREAHFVLTDTPLTLLAAVALLLAVRAAERPGLGRVALAGAAVGAATAIKYTGIVAVVLPLIAALALPRHQRFTGLAVGFGTTGLAYLICAPYTVLALPEFLNGMAYLMQSYNEPRGWTDTAAVYRTHLRNGFTWPEVLPLWTGWIGLSLTGVGLATLVTARLAHTTRLAAALIAIFSVVFFSFVSGQSLLFGRYLLPLGPALSVGLAVGVSTVAGLVRAEALRRWIVTGSTGLIVLPLLAASVAWNRAHVRPTTTDQVAAWLVAHAGPGTRIVSEVPLQLPPHLGLTLSPSLTRQSLDDYRRQQVTHLILSAVVSGRYADADAADPAAAAYRALTTVTEPIATFVPDGDHPGVAITILRVPPRAN